jgi:hypothetical protein
MINPIARLVIESYPRIRIAELSPLLHQVWLGGSDLVANLYESSATVRICSREEDESAGSWREVSYNDPAFEEKLRRYLDVRLKYTPEERLRYLRQEEVKRYFEVKRRTHKFAGDAE